MEILKGDFVFKASRSSGPGGQNVNKLNTRITVFFNVAECAGFTDSQKKTILKKLATRSNKNGEIRVASQRFRTQVANRKAAVKKLTELIEEALRKRPVRKKTKSPNWADKKRLQDKTRRAQLKQQRTNRDFEF